MNTRWDYGRPLPHAHSVDWNRFFYWGGDRFRLRRAVANRSVRLLGAGLKIYDRALGIKIGDMQRVRDFDLTDVAVKAKMRERHGNELPLDAPVISPVAKERSPLLVMVTEQ